MDNIPDSSREFERLSAKVAALEGLVERLKEAEEKSHFQDLLLDTVEQAVIVTDVAGKILYWSHFAEKLYGWQKSEVEGRNIIEIGPSEVSQEEADAIFDSLRAGNSRSNEFVGRHKDGTTFPAWVTNAPIHNEAGELIGFVGLSRNISDMKQTEEKLRASLKEKEILLKEIHHRVKNNLQIISSLLMLQARYVRDPLDKELFLESQNRLYSMALIHEQLYKTESLEQIDCKNYIEELISNLRKAYRAGTQAIEFEVRGDKIVLDIDSAVPFSLVLNELVSNSLKHAFPNGQQGKIQIEIWKKEDDYISLRIKDNGTGLPAGLDLDSPHTFGLRLVQTLTRQLHGVLEVVENEHGAEFSLTFKAGVISQD